MAFANKISNLLKKAVTSNPSLYQAVRCMSSSKLFVGGVSYGTDDNGLREAFSQHGEVVEARVIMDRETGRSRGFGFITYTSSEEASAAIAAMDGKDLHGRIIRVNYATERTGGFRGGYGGGDSGGYGGGGYGGGGGGSGGYGGGGYGGGGYGSGSGYGGGGGYGGNYGNTGNYGGNTGYGGNYEAGDRNTSNYPADNYVSGGGSGNYTVGGGGGDGLPISGSATGYDGSGATGNGNSNSSDQYGSSLDGSPKGGHGGNQEDLLDDFKEDDETDDYAKRA